MATSFNSGFALGNQMFNQAERNRLLAAQEARETEAHKQRMEEAGIRTAGLRRVENATQDLDRMTRVGVQVPDAIKANDADFDMAVEATGRGLPMPKAAPMQPEWRPATGLELNQAQMGLAAARGDVQGMEALRTGRRQMGVQDALDRAAKMPENELADLFPQLNTRAMAGLPIYDAGDVLGKDGKPTGYRTIRTVGKDGKPNMIDLSPAKQREMAAAYMLMQEGFGAEGLAKLSAIDKDLADTVAKYNQSVAGVVSSNNQATRFGNQDANDTAKLGVTREYYQNRTQMDRMGAAQYFTGQDGNTYAAIPTMGRNGLSFQTVQVNPTGVKLGKVGGSSEKAVEVPEAGKIMVRGNRRFMTDGLGGEIEVDARGRLLGIMPTERDSFATKTLGMNPAMANQLEFSKDGRYILAPNGAEYDTQDKGDMARIKDDITAFAAQDPDEYERRMLRSRFPAPTGIGPRITYTPQPGAPSIYAGPEAWAARAQQQQGR